MRYNSKPRVKRAHIRGDVAQLGEHHVRNVGVVGSNPIISTTEHQVRTQILTFLFCATNMVTNI